MLNPSTHFCFTDYAKVFDYVDHHKLWKILKEMGIPDHLTCLLRNLCVGQEATVRTGHRTTDSFQIWKGVCQGCILSPCLFNLCAEYIMRNAGLDEAQTEIRIAGRNINNLRYADDTTLMAESEELKSLLMKVKEESEKVGLKHNIQKTKIMESGSIPSWEIDGETVETVTDFILGGSKITTDGDCSHEIKRHLFLGRKVKTNLDSILKSRDFANRGPSCQGYGFSSSHVWMWELDLKKAEHQRIDAFELWCWRRLLRIPWTARRSSQPILKNIRVPWWLYQPVSAAGDWAASAPGLAVFSGSWGSSCHLHTLNHPMAPYFRVCNASASLLQSAGSCCRGFTFPHVKTAGPAGHLRLFAAPSPQPWALATFNLQNNVKSCYVSRGKP